MRDTNGLLDHSVINRQVFYPRTTMDVASLVVESDGYRLGCHVREAHPGAGWVVYFHGNGELASECDQFCSGLFTRAGVNICFAEYRGYGTSDGQPALAAMLADGERIVDALRQPPQRIVVFGRSLGSLYAIELARRLPSIGGLVLESGIANLNDLWSLDQAASKIGCEAAAINAAIAADFDHQAKLSEYCGPLMVLHAAGDRLVEQSHAERLHAWGGGSDKRLVVFPHGNHNTIQLANAAEYLAEVRNFLRLVGLASQGKEGIVEPAAAPDLPGPDETHSTPQN